MSNENKTKHHNMSTIQLTKSDRMRAIITVTLNELDDCVPEGREKSLAITKLEESLMWANKAIALEE